MLKFLPWVSETILFPLSFSRRLRSHSNELLWLCIVLFISCLKKHTYEHYFILTKTSGFWISFSTIFSLLLSYDSVVHVMIVSKSYNNSTVIDLDCFKWSRTCQIYLTIFYEIRHFKVKRILDLEFQDYYIPFKLIFTLYLLRKNWFSFKFKLSLKIS